MSAALERPRTLKSGNPVSENPIHRKLSFREDPFSEVREQRQPAPVYNERVLPSLL